MVSLTKSARRIIVCCGIAAVAALGLLPLAPPPDLPERLAGVGVTLRASLYVAGVLFVLATALAGRGGRMWPAGVSGAVLLLASAATSSAYSGWPVSLIIAALAGAIAVLTALATMDGR